ncbi:putative phage protein (TIGR01671 family) [Sedimentibacter acidaminivorans]|uniref:Phage protein (TIGR01671 family) n=1 Tax=Sedimentibacter acidaminivorans TaxID=913099 RepID=A0ABS4GGX0_9FIRM|nr:YopX family protein [Sedimentibacter acidaminivorans]MBP1926867.1 putative phage protein (TIGR01671 family) [Sedimentibacter acidaminivorans]
MSEIKFRGKRVDNGKWVYGGSIIKFNGENGIFYYMPKERDKCTTEEDKNDNISKIDGNFYLVTNVCQYTGVCDDTENENKIYKGDIIKFTYEDEEIIGRVEYEAGSYIIVSNELSDGYISFLKLVDVDRDYCWIPSSVVVGNLYENSELLVV